MLKRAWKLKRFVTMHYSVKKVVFVLPLDWNNDKIGVSLLSTNIAESTVIWKIG